MMSSMTLGMMGGSWSTAGAVLNVGFWAGVTLLAFWLYRFIKDEPANKRLLAWGLGLTIGVLALTSIGLTSYGMMRGPTSKGMSSGMMGMMQGVAGDSSDGMSGMMEMMGISEDEHQSHHPEETIEN